MVSKEGLLSIFGLTLTVIFVLLVPFTLSTVLFFESLSFIDYGSQDFGFMFIQTSLISLSVLVYFIFSGWWTEIYKDLRVLNKTDFMNIVYLLFSVIVGMLIVIFFGINNTTDQAGFALVENFFLKTVSLILVMSVVEEILFRGFLQKKMREITTSIVARVAYPSVLFALFHIPSLGGVEVLQILALFLLGCIFGYTYEKENNLIVPIILHSSYNLIILTAFSFGL